MIKLTPNLVFQMKKEIAQSLCDYCNINKHLQPNTIVKLNNYENVDFIFLKSETTTFPKINQPYQRMSFQLNYLNNSEVYSKISFYAKQENNETLSVDNEFFLNHQFSSDYQSKILTILNSESSINLILLNLLSEIESEQLSDNNVIKADNINFKLTTIEQELNASLHLSIKTNGNPSYTPFDIWFDIHDELLNLSYELCLSFDLQHSENMKKNYHDNDSFAVALEEEIKKQNCMQLIPKLHLDIIRFS